MSNEIHHIRFNKDALTLELRFEKDEYNVANIRCKLLRDGNVLNESASIPVRSLFNMAYLTDVSLRLYAIKTEQELLRMVKFNNGKGKQRGKKDKAK